MTSRHRERIQGTAAVLLFAASALVGLALFGLAVISDLEGATFDPGIRGGATLRSLDCPMLITTSESGTVRATLDNPLDRSVRYLMRVHVSQGFVTLFREIDYQVPLAPGEKTTLEWEVTAADAAYGWLVLVKVWQSASYPQPSLTGSCGIPVVPVPFLTGDQFFGLLFAASVLGMGLGIAMWKAAGRSTGSERDAVSNAMFALGGTQMVGILIAATGEWLPALVVFAGSLLLTFALIFYFLFRVE